ncbi:MAG: hypothetical protein IKC26_10030 [Clostridia bacterium]|nr:hypothetical protein [Clostridia bacterium]MBR2908360.1 hypothetical protein [Clostridia bacterium]
MKVKDRAKPKLPPVEPGVYMAVCIGVIDLGEQYSEMFKSYSNKVMFVWELPTETVEVDGEQKPRQLSKEFTVSSSNKSNFRKFIESWNSKSYGDDEFLEFDIFDQVGKPCQLNVVLNETKEYSNVDNLMPIPKGFPAPQSNTERIYWDMDAWNDEVFGKLPEWIQEKIKKSSQYQHDHAPATTVEVKPPENSVSEKECPI